MLTFTSLTTRLVVCVSITLLITTAIAYAAPIIPVGDISLFAGTSGQVVPLLVQGNVPVQGLNLNLSVEGGGPEIDPARQRGPRITRVDVINNTIFSGNNLGQTFLANMNQAWAVSTVTSFGNVNTNGVLAWVTFDTHDIANGSGPYELTLADPLGSPTDFAGVPATLGVGRITISGVPEPSSVCLLGLGSLGFVLRRRV